MPRTLKNYGQIYGCGQIIPTERPHILPVKDQTHILLGSQANGPLAESF